MIVRERDLDPALLKKVTRLDEIVENHSEGSDGFLTYDGNNFSNKKINTFNFRRIISLSEINNIFNNFRNPDTNIISSFNNVFIKSNDVKLNYKNFLTEIEETMLNNEVHIFDKLDSGLVYLDKKGYLHILEYDKFENTEILNLVDLFIDTFGYNNFNVNSILNLEVFDNNNMFISTVNNGVFKFNLLSDNLELLFKENNVTEMKLVNNKKSVLLISNNDVMVYNLESKLKTDKFNILKAYNQFPISIETYNDIYLIPSLTFGLNSQGNILHGLKEDQARISLNLIDHEINNVKPSEVNNIVNVSLDGNNLYIFKQDKYEISYIKYELTDFSISYGKLNLKKDFNKIVAHNDLFYILSNKHILVLDENEDIKMNLKVQGNVIDILNIDNDVIYLTDNYIGKFNSSFDTKTNKAGIRLFRSEETYNDVTVILSGINDTKYKFIYDNKEISPHIAFKHDNNIYVKFININLETLSVRLDGKVDDIIVNLDKVFLR